MSRRKYARVGIAAIAAIVMVAVAVPAFAGALPARVTQKIVTSTQPLYYICAIHPWMSGAINARPVG